jgi:diaminohydroxyphosphoribosylaminopyrimidine deaminase / 5-amino-6-(5-phosphoribosylamino)uracil reductase
MIDDNPRPAFHEWHPASTNETMNDSAAIAQMLGPLIDAPAGRPFVVAQLGQSLDGRIATPTGESRWINKEAALDHVHRLRAHVDAVVVGIGTALADDPMLNVRRVNGRNPARVVIDPRGRLHAARRCLSGDDGCRRIVIRSSEARGALHLPSGVELITLEPEHDGKLNPVAIVNALTQRGLPKLLIEGGAWTVSEFIMADAVDRLHVLVAPIILGSGKTGLALAPIDKLSEALRPSARVFPLADGDVLFDCDLRTAATESPRAV